MQLPKRPGRQAKVLSHAVFAPENIALTVCLLCAWVFAGAAEPSRYDYEAGVDISYVDASGYRSWTQGSAGKLRYDGETDGLVLSRAFAAYKLRLADTLNASVAAEVYDDGVGSGGGFTQAFLEWRPLSMTPNRYRLKVGAFYPRVSIENTGSDWSSPYTITPSAINTWIGEEFRVVGAEASITRRLPSLGSAHTVALHAAVFYQNDPAGTLLSWKGWSLHDRQSRLGDPLPLPPVPQIQPGMWFDQQDPFVAPFREIDNRAGYYVNGEWTVDNRFLLRVMHYDNRADPQAYENGQFGWRTDFNHIGIQTSLPGGIGLIAQHMLGATVWGRENNGIHAVDAEYESSFLLLTRAMGQHRVSLRYDRFNVSENDQTPLDNNSEHGRAWTVAYQVQLAEHASLATEWLQIQSRRDAWEYYGLEPFNTERQLQLSLRLRFGNQY